MRLIAKQQVRDLGAFAFYQGAHNLSLADTLQEVAATHDIERAKLHEESLRREKPLEAAVEQLESRQPIVDSAWAVVLRRSGPTSPPITAATIVGILGLAGLVVDAILLGPGLDAIGISDVLLQYVAAFGLAALAATLFHLAYETLGNHSHSLNITICRRALAGIAVIALLAWGILRGYQVKFAADLNQNPLGNLLGDHPVLGSIFFSFVTLAAPLVGAAAFHDAHPRLHTWFAWKRSKRAYDRLHEDLVATRKKLDEERQTCERALAQLDAQQATWGAIAAQYFECGRTLGTRQQPHWIVILKATGWFLVSFAVACVVGRFLPPLYFVLPFGTGITAFLFYRRVRVSQPMTSSWPSRTPSSPFGRTKRPPSRGHNPSCFHRQGRNNDSSRR